MTPFFGSPATPPADALLAAIVESSDDAIVSKSLQGTVTSWNSGATRIFGYDASEMIGQPISKIFPADRLHEEPEILRRLQRGERVDHFETVRITKEGRHINISATISPVRDHEGKIVGASKVARDITHQKEAQSKMAQLLDDMKRNERMKAEFVATLSHELRTPLNAIVGWLEILKSPDVTPNEMQEGLDAIDRNTKSQVRMIEDLLDMSRIETGKILLDLQSLDIAAVCSAAINSIEPVIKAKALRLTTAFDSINGIVMGDRNRLQQVIWNLLTNAAKFTPKGGRIHVTIERINSHLELAVRDNGIGISEELITQIFDRFRQADSSITRKYGGLGLGLSIAKHLVELHGGLLSAKSPGLNQGATFIMALPVTAAHFDEKKLATIQRNSELDENMEPANLSKCRVLIVDDDPDSLAVLRRILNKYKAQVVTASSANEAIRLFKMTQPTILLSDIGMPERDGYDLIKEIKKLPSAAGVPAIALTALVRPEDRIRALRAGFQMHLGKPVNPDELVATIQNLMALREDFT